MRRDVQAIVLILVGGALLRISLTDMYLRYVKEGLRPALIAAGAILLVVGLISAVRDGIRRPDRPAAAEEVPVGDDGHGHDDGHDHTGGPRVAWLLCLPVLALFLIAPPALGSYSAQRSDNVVAKPAAANDDAGFPPLPAGDPLTMTVSDFLIRAVWDTASPLKDRTVRMTGFVTPGHGGTWYLTRMVISCCAADALARKVEVHGVAAPPADTWVTVTGTWLPNGQLQQDDAMPQLTASAVERIAAPREPYE